MTCTQKVVFSRMDSNVCMKISDSEKESCNFEKNSCNVR